MGGGVVGLERFMLNVFVGRLEASVFLRNCDFVTHGEAIGVCM